MKSLSVLLLGAGLICFDIIVVPGVDIAERDNMKILTKEKLLLSKLVIPRRKSNNNKKRI